MDKRLLIIFLCFSAWYSSSAQEARIANRFSPKLKKFLADHPTAINILTNAFTEVFSNRTVAVYYFYSDDDSEARAFHYYPNTVGMTEVVICVRENQDPFDEFITILYETLNSKGEARFVKLLEDARGGAISRENFARGILRVEFEAVTRTQELLKGVKVPKKEQGKSHYYKTYADCPKDFEAFLSYNNHLPGKRDVVKEYELKYDELRKAPN